MHAYSTINMGDNPGIKVDYKHFTGGGLHSVVFESGATTVLHFVVTTEQLARLSYEIQGALMHAHEEEGADGLA